MALNAPNTRVMKRGDLDAVAAIDALVTKQERRQYYERKIESVITNPHNINTSLVAEVDGKIVGLSRSVLICSFEDMQGSVVSADEDKPIVGQGRRAIDVTVELEGPA